MEAFNSASVGSIAPIFNILMISVFPNSRALGLLGKVYGVLVKFGLVLIQCDIL